MGTTPSSAIYVNCRLAFPDHLSEGALLTEDGRITAIWLGEKPRHVPAATQIFDCHGLILAPGLIDIHNHGALTHDFVRAEAEGNRVALRFHAEHGVTAILATVMTETPEQMSAALKLLAEQHAANDLPVNFIGIHLEGPYLHPDKRGAHKLDCLRDPAPSEYGKFWKDSRGLIRILTHAPERKGSVELCQFLHQRGCLPAIGHTTAVAAEIRRAAAYGARHFVHANNAIDWPQRRVRPEGWLGTELMGMGILLSDSIMTGEVIADGYHIPMELMRVVLAARGSDHIALVSDASPATGCPQGEYLQGGMKIVMKERRLVLSAAGAIDGVPPLGGSGTPLIAMVRNFVGWGFGLRLALRMSTLVPARIIGALTKGLLRVGNDADLVLLDDEANLFTTIIGGRAVYFAEGSPITAA